MFCAVLVRGTQGSVLTLSSFAASCAGAHANLRKKSRLATSVTATYSAVIASSVPSTGKSSGLRSWFQRTRSRESEPRSRISLGSGAGSRRSNRIAP